MNLFENLQLMKEADNAIKIIQGDKCIFTNEFTAEQLYEYKKDRWYPIYEITNDYTGSRAYKLSFDKHGENSYEMTGTYSRGDTQSAFTRYIDKDEIVSCYIGVKDVPLLRISKDEREQMEKDAITKAEKRNKSRYSEISTDKLEPGQYINVAGDTDYVYQKDLVKDCIGIDVLKNKSDVHVYLAIQSCRRDKSSYGRREYKADLSSNEMTSINKSIVIVTNPEIINEDINDDIDKLSFKTKSIHDIKVGDHVVIGGIYNDTWQRVEFAYPQYSIDDIFDEYKDNGNKMIGYHDISILKITSIDIWYGFKTNKLGKNRGWSLNTSVYDIQSNTKPKIDIRTY